MSTGLVTAKKTDTVRPSVRDEMMNRHCSIIPVVEGDARLNGMVMVRDVLLPHSRALSVFLPGRKHMVLEE